MVPSLHSGTGGPYRRGRIGGRNPLHINAMAHAIEVAGLTKRFGPVLAVDDLSFTADEGRVVGFLGPNGAGKTTTLRMLLGLVNPTAGSATVNGLPLRELDDPVRTVGAVLDGGMLHPGRSGRNHLRTLAKAAGVGDRARRRAAGAGRAQRRGQPPRGRLLARHAPAARPRRRAARRPAGARPRRARQRPGPAGHPLAARLPAHARRRGPRGARLQPRARRGRPDRRRRGGDQQGPQRSRRRRWRRSWPRSGGGMRVAGPDVRKLGRHAARAGRAGHAATRGSSSRTAAARRSAA